MCCSNNVSNLIDVRQCQNKVNKKKARQDAAHSVVTSKASYAPHHDLHSYYTPTEQSRHSGHEIICWCDAQNSKTGLKCKDHTQHRISQRNVQFRGTGGDAQHWRSTKRTRLMSDRQKGGVQIKVQGWKEKMKQTYGGLGKSKFK